MYQSEERKTLDIISALKYWAQHDFLIEDSQYTDYGYSSLALLKRSKVYDELSDGHSYAMLQ